MSGASGAGVILLRIQNAAGRGPWIPGFSVQWSDTTPAAADLIPSFEQWPWILKRPPRPHSGIGCRDVATLRRWFSFAEYGRLLALGFRCVQIVPDQILGESAVQVLFRCDYPLGSFAQEVELYPGLSR